MRNFCGKCGSPVDAQTGLCPNCDVQNVTGGQQVIEPPIVTEEQSAPTNKKKSEKGKKVKPPKEINKKRTIRIAVISVVSVVLCIAIVFTTLFGLGFFNQNEKPDTETEKTKEKIPSVYEAVSKQYADALLRGFSDDQNDSDVKCDKFVNRNLILGIKRNQDYKVFFSLNDINDDGVMELIIGSGTNKNDAKLYDIFTNDGTEAIPLFPVGSIGDDKSLDVYDNGNIKVTDDKSPLLQGFDYYELPDKSTKVDHLAGFTQDDGTYYKHDENGNYITEISQEEYENAVADLESNKLKLEWTEFVPEDYVPDGYVPGDVVTGESVLTEEQVESFNNLLNADFDIWGNTVTGTTEVEYYINNYIFDETFVSFKSTMYDYYFPDQVQKSYSDPQNKFSGAYDNGKYCYVYDANKVLFILNNVFGLNVTTSERAEYFYFHNDKFYYYCPTDGNSEGAINYDYELYSYEKQADGYYLMNVIYTNSEGDSKEIEFTAKPETHTEYGDYWSIKSMNYKELSSSPTIEADWKQLYIDKISELETEAIDYSYYLFDADSDGVPELVCNSNSIAGGIDLFYMSNGKLKSQYVGYGSIYYNPQKGTFLASYGHMDHYKDNVYELKNGVLKEIAYGTTHYIYREDIPSEYYWMDVQVAEDEYNKKLQNIFDVRVARSLFEDDVEYDSSTIITVIQND